MAIVRKYYGTVHAPFPFNERIAVWDADTGTFLYEIWNRNNYAYSPAPENIVVGETDGRIYLICNVSANPSANRLFIFENDVQVAVFTLFSENNGSVDNVFATDENNIYVAHTRVILGNNTSTIRKYNYLGAQLGSWVVNTTGFNKIYALAVKNNIAYYTLDIIGGGTTPLKTIRTHNLVTNLAGPSFAPVPNGLVLELHFIDSGQLMAFAVNQGGATRSWMYIFDTKRAIVASYQANSTTFRFDGYYKKGWLFWYVSDINAPAIARTDTSLGEPSPTVATIALRTWYPTTRTGQPFVVTGPSNPPYVFDPNEICVSTPVTFEDPCSANMKTPQAFGIIKVPVDPTSTSSYNYFTFAPSAYRDAAAYYKGPKYPRLLELGPSRRTASDWKTGAIEVQTMRVKLADVSRAFRSAVHTNLGSLLNSECGLYLASYARRISEGNPRLAFYGVIDTDVLSEDQTYTATLKDPLGATLTLSREELIVPRRELELDFPGFGLASTNSLALDILRAPIIGGMHSDVDPSTWMPGQTKPMGCVPLIYVGTKVGKDGRTFHVALQCGHACHLGVIEVYNQDGDVYTWGAEIFAPGHVGWASVNPAGSELYTDINNRWYTLVVMPTGTTVGDRFADGTIQLNSNTHGLTVQSNGTGGEITDLHLLYKHVLINFILRSWESGGWLASPSFEYQPGGDIVCRVDTQSFVDAQDVAKQIVSGGFVGRFIIGVNGRGISAQSLIAKFNVQANVSLAYDKYNRYRVVMLDRTGMLDGRRAITHYRDTYDSKPLRSPLLPGGPFTHLRGGWRLNHRTGQYERLGDLAVSTLPFGGRAAPPESYDLVGNDATAAGLGAERLAFMKYARRVSMWQEGMCGYRNDLLDVVPLRHYNLQGAAAAPTRNVWIRSQTLNGDFTVDSEAYDITDLLP